MISARPEFPSNDRPSAPRGRATTGAARALLLICLSTLCGVGISRGGTIAGRVFTADHPDSIAPGAAVSLVFRLPQGEMVRQQTAADASGHFHFIDLAADTSIAYVLRIDYKGMQFLSEPIQFTPGEDVVDYNILLSGGEPPMEEMPAGHPPVGSGPPLGRPVRPNALHAVILVAWVVLMFVLLALIARRKPATEDPTLAPGARDLVRDIASLDNRHADGVIGEEEYRKVREGLMRRLRAMSAKGRHA